MKITHIVSSPASGGAEVYVKDLAISMAQGNDVFILFLDRAIELNRDVDYESRFLAELTEANIKFGFIGNKARTNGFIGIKAIRKHIKEFSPDIIHCHLYYAVIFSLFSNGPKIIYTHHNIVLGAPRLIYKILNLKVAGYIGICKACTSLLGTLTHNKLKQINNAVSRNRLLVSNAESIKSKNDSEINILMIGRLTEQKNYLLMFESIKLLKGLPIKVKIAGEGELYGYLSEKIKDMNIGDEVELIGNVSNIPELLLEADVFAMTSAWEGLPISLIEATLSGVPSIVTNVGGCEEIIDESSCGIVVKECTAANYSRFLKRMVTDHEFRHQLAINALNYSNSYELDSSVINHLDFYEEILLER